MTLGDLAAAASVLTRAGMIRPLVPTPALLGLGLRLPFTTPSLATAIAFQAASRPSALALVDERGGLSWRRLDERVNRLAHVLLDRAGPEATMAFMVRNGREAVEGYAAPARAGIPSVPVNTWFSGGDLAHLAESQRPGVVVVDPEFADEAAEAFGPERLLRTGEDYEAALAAAPGERPDTRGAAKVITHTSGTTGRPKGAERDVSAEALSSLVGFLEKVPLHREHEFCIPSPLFHAFGQGMLSVALTLGTTLLLPSRFDAGDLLATIAEREVEAVALVPIMLRRLLEEPDPPPTPSWRICVLSGSALPRTLRDRAEERFGRIFYDLYGSTEVGFATIATPQDAVERPGSVGRPSRGTEVLIVDDDGEPLPPGEVGRITVRTGMAFQGYTGRDDGQAVDGTIDMGDLGYLDDDGYLYVTGRADDMVVSGGENVYPSEVEEALETHPDLAEVAVVGVPDEEYGEVLHAHVVPRGRATVTAEDVIAHARQHLARYKVPKQVHVREDLPRNAAGKVVKSDL